MLKNYFKTTLRHLKKNKGYALINTIGLSLGMACATLILLWVYDELQYNKFHKNYSQLYRVIENQSYEGKIYTFSAMPGLFAAAAKSELPEIKYAARSDWGTQSLFSFGEKSIYETGYYTDPDFLKMFSFNLLQGDKKKILADPTSILVTEKMAKKFFGKENALGKTLKVDNDKVFTITGIIKDLPENSSLHFSWLASFKIYEEKNTWLSSWGNNGIQTYVQLKETADPSRVNKKFHDFIQKKDTTALARPFLLSMKDWRLRSNFEEGKQVGGKIQYIRLFSIIALLIIIVACINFMNLATARSEQRAREVGVRKVMGAERIMLVRQFMSESIFMAFAAMLIAALIVFLVLPSFNLLVEKKLEFSFGNPVIILGLPILALICGVLAGSYPSLYLSSFNPITIFRGLKIGRNSSAILIRKGLVITQFVVSIALIISTLIIYQQIQHIKNRELGYNKDNIVMLGLKGKMSDHFPAIHQDLLNTGMVENATLANSRVLELGSSTEGFSWQGKDPSKKILITTEWVSPEYISTMHMHLKSGRDFYSDAVQDSSNVIINETLADIIGKKNPVGELLQRDNENARIIGVVKNFVFNDIYGKPDPLILLCRPAYTSRMLIRLKTGADIPKALSKVGSVLGNHDPGYPFDYAFLDIQFDNLFKTEMLIGKLSRLFAMLTVLISCLGLFGLAAYTAERRTKEIGIRKVLGATVSNMVTLLSKDFLQLVSIAAVIAFPLSWWAMHKWLQDFAYRITISWWVFVIAGVLAIVIALVTVSFQAIKAAIANPVKSLRTE